MIAPLHHISAPMRQLSDYISSALTRTLPDAVVEEAQGGTTGASVVGTRLRVAAVNAALANGMLAHADETDDSHAPSRTHPGCAVVPAALAIAERQHASGEQ